MARRIRLSALSVPLIVAISGAASGCAIFSPESTVPMPVIEIAEPRSEGGTLIVLLPGMGDRASQFLESGFVEASAGSGYALLAADAHSGYYFDGSLIERLRTDVITPERTEPYSAVWLLGVSMGGLGGILYSSQIGAGIDGVILLAPYLGDRCLAEEIAAAGGLRAWSGESQCTVEFEINAWRWLKKSTQDRSTDIILGFGSDDPLARTYGPLVDALPSSQVYTVAGGHKWTTWNELWMSIGNAAQFKSRQ